MKYSELCSILHLFKKKGIELTEKEIENIISANDKMPTDYLTTLNGLMKNKELLKRILANKNLIKHMGTIKFVNSFIPECTDKWIELLSKDESYACLIDLLSISALKEILFDEPLLNLIMSQGTDLKRRIVASACDSELLIEKEILLKAFKGLETEEEIREVLLLLKNDSFINSIYNFWFIPIKSNFYGAEGIREIRLCFESQRILNDRDLLGLIYRQNAPDKMREMRLAMTQIPNIMERKDIIKLIAKQNDSKRMGQLRKACMHDYIREDEELLNLILLKWSYEEREEIIKACLNEEIRNNRQQLKLIAFKRSVEEMRALREKIEEENEKKKFLIEGLKENPKYKKLLKNKCALDIIMSFDSIEMRKALIDAYCYGIDVGNQKLFLLMSGKETIEDMEKLKIKFEDPEQRKGIYYYDVDEEDLEDLRNRLNSYISNNNYEAFVYLCNECDRYFVPIDSNIECDCGKIKVKQKKN